MIFFRKHLRIIALFLVLDFSIMLLSSTKAFALTSGPKAPEFSSFTPVATTDMVNLFTGDFNYNLPVIEIPGAEGGGYALSLSYQSGTTSEQEASWVGYGWSLNPGAINRHTRGLPDDANGTPVDYYNKARPNWTVNMTHSTNLEIFSQSELGDPKTKEELKKAVKKALVDGDKGFDFLRLSKSLRFNNYQGFYPSIGLGLTANGLAGMNMSIDNNGATFSADINPMGIFSALRKKSAGFMDASPEKLANGLEDRSFSARLKNLKNKTLRSTLGRSIGSNYGIFTFQEAVRPTHFSKYSGFAFHWSFSTQFNPTPLPVGVEQGGQGGFSMQYNRYLDSPMGYGYLHSDKAGGESMMDYFVEKGSAFDKRDVFIGIPFANQDIFSLTGEGLSGGFRAYTDKVGHYRPNTRKSKINIGQIGFETMIGVNNGGGVRIGYGEQRNEIGAWSTDLHTFAGRKPIFRFNNDMGGKVDYTENTEKQSAIVGLQSLFPGFRRAKALAPQSEAARGGIFRQKEDRGRSSFIATEHAESSTPDKITGFVVHNENGLKYSYTEPVYVRNESQLSVDIKHDHPKEKRYIAFRHLPFSNDDNQYAVAKLNSHDYHTVYGEIRKEKFANTYLLSSICTPDYIDVDADTEATKGPSQKDFGGWTKFNYDTLYGEGKDKWYRYRTPYNGLLYQANSLSDTKDDVGSLTTGEKEVKYLKSIETNTHIAYFVTNTSRSDIEQLKGSLRKRPDGLGAAPVAEGRDPAAEKGTANKPVQGDTELEFLEKIVLYAKDREGAVLTDRALKVVRFDYDWSLVPNVPNNSNSHYSYAENAGNSTDANSGKLTLKKVWFEYGGTVPAKVSPYEFSYTYRHSSSVDAAYRSYFEAYDGLSDLAQNPSYSPYLLSPWGYPMINGRERKAMGIPWIDQSAYLDEAMDFDPAAWQLKSIKLPSGGEIFVQYEQNDYGSVQDRLPMAMANILGDIREQDGYLQGIATGDPSDDFHSYPIDVRALGVNPNDSEKMAALAQKIEHYFETDKSGKKIYFKFLYALKGRNPSLDDCRSDYISGYANFKSARVGSFDHPDGSRENTIYITLKNDKGKDENENRAAIPRQACYELVVNQRQGKLDNALCVEDTYEAVFDRSVITAMHDNEKGGFGKAKKIGVAISVILDMAFDPRVITYPLQSKRSVCEVINAPLSFFKLPMYGAKKGGGVRVKRLLMYDPGLEAGTAALFGTEYHYEKEDGTTSGVATAEPGAAREENPLVTFIAKDKQTWFSRITVGKDKEQSEGPIGESLLPAASIGYSRVVAQNIHTGRTGTGYSIHEYHTAENYPFDGDYGGVGDEDQGEEEQSLPKFDAKGKGVEYTSLNDQQEIDHLSLPLGIFNLSTNKVYTAQGFRFIINSMHGQMKKMSQYSGTYRTGVVPESMVAAQDYEYYAPGEQVRMLRWSREKGTFEEYFEVPGKEMEIILESRQVKDVSMDFSLELDLSFSMPPSPFVSLWPAFSHDDKLIATHATTKILRYPAILKKVTNVQDGVSSTTHNIAFNTSTGQPILTKTEDSFHELKLAGRQTPHNGAIYNFEMPAEWAYPKMGQKSKDIDNTNQLNTTTASFTVYGKQPDPDWFLDPKNLLAASIQTFSNNWTDSWSDPVLNRKYGTEAHIDALNQVWRPKSSYVYKTAEASSQAEKKIYESGYFDIEEMFDWEKDEQEDTQWIKTAEVTKYSPHGNALEEKNVLDIYSSVIFGEQYGNHLPVMVAQNARQNTIHFQDFENSGLENGTAHSGKGAKVLTDIPVFKNLKVSQQLVDQGGVLMVWLKFDQGQEEELVLTTNEFPQTLNKVARTGDWLLYSTHIPGSTFADIGEDAFFGCTISGKEGTFGQTIHMDDLRFQPWDAEASCYVYDPDNFRLLAQFDAQHFGLYYQYNEEGQLIRKIIETERGKKTIQETQYNTPMQYKKP